MSDQAVGIFIQPPLPGMMGRGEIENDTGIILDGAVIMELGTVIRGDGPDTACLSMNEFNDPPVEVGRGPGLEFTDEGVFGFAFDHGNDTVMVIGPEHGVDLPVPVPRAVVRAWRAL